MTRCKRLQAIFVLLFSMLFLQLLHGQAPEQDPRASLHLERLDTGTGAELLTLFSTSTMGHTEPVISVLRDTLGDSNAENDKIRYIWVLSHSRPSIKQRLQAGLPFFHQKSGAGKPRAGKPPAPTLDYSSTGLRAWREILGKMLQRGLLDNNGFWLRAVSRSYSTNAADYRNMEIAHSLETISQSSPLEQGEPDGLSVDDLDRIQGRLILAQRFLGDLVRESYLIPAKQQYDLRSRSTRASNWDLLRQKAEENGLYFQQLNFESEEPSHVLLWVAREDLATPRLFDNKLLEISSPWGDPAVEEIGYSETWYFDLDNRRVEAGSPHAHPVEVIPLALYGLNHPKAPLLIVDFRNPGKVRHKEIGRSAIHEATSNVFALSIFGNWTYMGVRSAWDFFRGRSGAPVDRQARLNGYSSFRRVLATDTELNPELHRIIAQSVDSLSVNPFERSMKEESAIAEQHYQDLVAWAKSPDGLAARLDRERGAEMVTVAHGKPLRGLFTLAKVASFGLYQHREHESPALMARLDRRRRIAYHVSRLQEVLDSSPRLEVVANVENVRRSVESLTVLSEQEPSSRKDIAKLVTRLFQHTLDTSLRRQCVESLASIQGPEAARGLAALLENPVQPATPEPVAAAIPESDEQNLNPRAETQ